MENLIARLQAVAIEIYGHYWRTSLYGEAAATLKHLSRTTVLLLQRAETAEARIKQLETQLNWQ